MPNLSSILAEIPKEFQRYKRMAEQAVEQLEDEELFVKLNSEQNSIATIMRHMAGNLRSRFTDFLSSDGEKPWRNREGEFAETSVPRAELMRGWEEAWTLLFDALSRLSDADLGRTVTIRGEAHTVFQALNRQTAHHAYHVGQIALLAKHMALSKGRSWRYLTIAPGQSQAFNEQMKRGG